MRRFRLIVYGLLLLLIAGCNLFTTRDPEPPESGSNIINLPRTPQDVLDNLTAAMNNRDDVFYMASFSSDSFRFEPDAVTLARESWMATWGYEQERQHISGLINTGTQPGAVALAVLLTTLSVDEPVDSTTIRVHYDITADVSPNRFSGTADFVLRMGSAGYWQIYRWRDFRTDEQSTWSDLKSLVH